MIYVRNLLSMTTRWLNSLFGGNRRGESMSSAVGRKAAQGRRWAIAAEGLIDAAFALVFGQRHHCAVQAERESA